jgi:hypothetical protein
MRKSLQLFEYLHNFFKRQRKATSPNSGQLEKRKGWIDALIAFDKDPESKIPCPTRCGANLEFFDVEFDSISGPMADRYINCPKCGAYEVALMSKTPALKEP